MEFYLIRNGQQVGPFSLEELANQGITAETEVWTQGMADWQQAGDVPALTTLLQQQQFNKHQADATTPIGTPYDNAITNNQQTYNTPPPRRPYIEPAKSNSGCTRWLLVALILAVLFATMVFTCPGQRAHEQAIQQVTRQWVDEKVEQKSPLPGVLNELIKYITGSGTDMAISHYLDVKNYLVCSVGKMSVSEGKDKMVSLGIFGHVFTFDKDDIEQAWARAMDQREQEHSSIVPPTSPRYDNDSTNDEDSDPNSPFGINALPDSIIGIEIPDEMDSMFNEMANEAIRMAKEWAKKQIDEFGK